jgi:phosphatidylinositol alpha-1,6-mannosyltransferase
MDVQMRTILLSELFPPRTGGSSRWFWEVYRRLPRSRYRILAGEDSRQEEFDSTHDLAITRMPLMFRSWGISNPRSLWDYLRAVRQLRQLVRREQIGMIHCGRCLPEGLIARILKLWRGTPYCCYVHGEEMNYASGSRELACLARWVLRDATFLIANSRNTESILRDQWDVPPERIQVLHPGVDIERFVPAERNPAERERLGWGDRPVVLTVGRLQKRKGHDQMIRALQSVRRSIPNVLYAIVGDGEERAFLNELVAGEGLSDQVQFLGEVNDQGLVRCYQQCDLFALPNRQVGQDIEGFGMVLVEAQACGKPVLAGASGGTAETMRLGETGLVVDCEGPDLLASAVIDLLQDKERLTRMGEAGRQWVVEHFDWEALAHQAGRLFDGEDAQDKAPLAEVAAR